MNPSTLLLVEDNPNDEALALRALRKNQINNPVVVARDGAEAIDYLFGTGAYAHRDPNDLPAVILLDLNLPKYDGHEVLRRLRENERTKLVPVVVLTTSIDARDVARSYELRANSYIRKPVDFAEFTRTIAQLGAYWLSLQVRYPTTG